MPVYLSLQPIRHAARDITIASGGLLPHLFTLTPVWRRLFSVTLLYRYRQLPVKKYGALCCPDFPHTPHAWVSDEMSALLLRCKDSYFRVKNKRLWNKLLHNLYGGCYQRLATACNNFFFDVLVKCFVSKQFFHSQVHAIAPIVAWVSWHIDLFFEWVFTTNFAIDRQPIL